MSKTVQPDLFATDTISAKLIKAKKAYYDGKAIMSDADFDALEDELRQINPKHIYFSAVGAPINSKAKFKHVIPMLSAGKAKTFDEVEAWAKKMGITKEIFVAEPKIDGLSATCIYENGKLVTVVRVTADADSKTIETAALADEKVQSRSNGKTVAKVIVVPGKLVNLVVR